MGSCAYVGRVGGLAVALGVGAAVLGGTAVGWADDDTSPSSSADHASAQTRGPGRTPRGGAETSASEPAPVRGARGATASIVAPTAQRNSDSAVVTLPDTLSSNTIQTSASTAAAQAVAEVAAAEPVVAPEAQPAPVTDSAPASIAAPVVETAPVAQPAAEPVSAPAEVVAVPPGSVTALDDPLVGNGNGGVPVDTPLDWTVLAYSRRNPLSAASTLAAPQAAATTSAPVTLPIIMGPSGVPIPSDAYGTTVMNYYIPNGILGTQQLLFTPEGLYPITGVKSLPLNTSVDQGLQILNDSLSSLEKGTSVTVFGYSQSAIISSLLQGGYTVDINGTPTKLAVPADLQQSIDFVLVGNEMNPDGGFLSRFSGRGMPLLTLESLGIPFYGPTPGGPVPANGVEYNTTNYMRVYDGFSDFPRYPINLLADINAGLGIVYVHTQYAPTVDQATCAQKAFCLTEAQLAQKQLLPSSKPLTAHYYVIPTENLPLLQPLRDIPLIGNPLADLIQPALKALVNFGYADPAHGYSGGTQPYANELQPFDFLPPASLYGEMFKQFFDGIGQGIKDFIGDLGPNGSVVHELSSFTLPTLGPLAMGTSGGFISSVQQVITSVSDYISGTVAGIYAALLPTADVINAFVTTLPAYDANLFLYGMQEVFSGNVIQGLSDAVGLPIAATVGLSSTAGLVAALVWAQAILPVFGQAAPTV